MRHAEAEGIMKLPPACSEIGTDKKKPPIAPTDEMFGRYADEIES
jgi:hypothetical protein